MKTAPATIQRKLLGFIGEIGNIQSLCQTVPESNPVRIQREIEGFLTQIDIQEVKNLLKSDVQGRFFRQYILASLRAAIGKLKKAKKLLAQKSFELSRAEINYALLWIQQASKVAETLGLFKQVVSKHKPSNFFISPDQLFKNDIILSYKTTYYLSKSLPSKLVSLATNSSITHAMLVCHEKNESPKLLVSGDATHGLGLVSPTAAPGEIFLVMRPTNAQDAAGLAKAIKIWRERASYRLETPLKTEQDRWKFAEIKCQIASLVGFCYVLSVKTLARPLVMPNPIKNDSQIFCTELIDIIYKKAGILLSPRSEHDALLGPVELLYSPALSFVGVIARPEDLAHVEGEIKSQFFTDSWSLSRSFSGFLQNINTHFLS